jgi:hypothetical protein
MNADVVEKIADAVLYEGYVLYPYRPSALKNRQRFNFGVLYPREYSEVQSGADAYEMRTEFLAAADATATIEAKIRFLQMAARDEWQEGLERGVLLPACDLQSMAAIPFTHRFTFEGAKDAEGRCSEAIEAEAELSAVPFDTRIFKVSLVVRNRTSLENAAQRTRDEALLRSMVSVHSILQVTGGEFISSLDPPEQFKNAVKACKNLGTWPVLAGVEGQRDLIFSAPIILYDYPQIAPESDGDLCDGLEIDEILSLRILTMTDAEKQEVRSGDQRARRILERTEMMPAEHFQKLHGALRGLKPTGLQPVRGEIS